MAYVRQDLSLGVSLSLRPIPRPIPWRVCSDRAAEQFAGDVTVYVRQDLSLRSVAIEVRECVSACTDADADADADELRSR